MNRRTHDVPITHVPDVKVCRPEAMGKVFLSEIELMELLQIVQ